MWFYLGRLPTAVFNCDLLAAKSCVVEHHLVLDSVSWIVNDGYGSGMHGKSCSGGCERRVHIRVEVASSLSDD